MPEFKKGNDWSNKFLSKSPWKKETRWEGPKGKTKDTKESKVKEKMSFEEAMKPPKGKRYGPIDRSRKFKKPSHLKATIAKDPSIDEELGLDKMKTTKATKKKDWEPAFEGADHSQEELDKMTKEEKEDYYN